MDKTRVFKNGGSVAVRLPAKYALPPGEIMIERKDEKLILTPLDAKGWPVDMEKWFTGAFDDFELPERPKDSRPIDYLIAGVARCHDWILITGNSREFKRVKNLKTEKW